MFCRIRIAASLAMTALAAAATASAADVGTVTAQEIDALVAQNEGKVVVVNFWATWCPPCLREFPDIIDVYEEYRDRGLEVYAVSMNDEEEIPDIEEFLENFAPPFAIYRAASLDSEFFESVLDTWYGEMPMTLIFDAAGNRVHVHKKALTKEELAADVAALIP